MIVDFRTADSPDEFVADICIVGAGPAGIAMAREFARSRRSVLVLESGGMSVDGQAQELNRGVNTRGDFSLEATRFRALGGTSWVWGGWCAPFDEIDFSSRHWVPHSGWPIALADLRPYYERAQPLCDLGPFRYDVQEWPALAARALALDPGKLEHKLWQLSPPTRFGEKYAEELRQIPNVTVLLYATATELLLDAGTRALAGIRVSSRAGRQARVRARAYVLATGGIETPRLMLASHSVASAGVGNDHDLVGRFFMEHPHPDAGGVSLSVDVEDVRPYFDRGFGDAPVVMGLGPSAAAQARLGILNSSVAVSDPLHSTPSQGWESLIKIVRGVESREWPENSGSLALDVLRDLDDVLREVYRRSRSSPVEGFRLMARTEAAPNPSNRVVLDRDRDPLGSPRARLEWRVGSLERETVEKTMRLVAEEFGRLDKGRVRISELLTADDTRWSENLAWFGHHMGTTRMSDNPRQGVVDRDCRVHGLPNLFIASSAVFPTGSYANPTLTILALALRLADHLGRIDLDALPIGSAV